MLPTGEVNGRRSREGGRAYGAAYGFGNHAVAISGTACLVAVKAAWAEALTAGVLGAGGQAVRRFVRGRPRAAAA
jgi:hypothetical protein